MGKRSKKNRRATRSRKLKERDGPPMDAAVQLAAQAEEEHDPFMRKLLLFAAGGAASSAAVRDMGLRYGERIDSRRAR